MTAKPPSLEFKINICAFSSLLGIRPPYLARAGMNGH